MRISCTMWIGVLIILGIGIVPCLAQDIAAADWMDESFNGFKTGSLYEQGDWRTETWLMASQSHVIVDNVLNDKTANGKSIGIVANNGYHSRLSLTPKTCGVVLCSFDFKPADGMFTFMGFKTPKSVWDCYQVPLRIAPPHAGGHIQTCKDGKFVTISNRPLHAGKWYHFEITIYPGSEENQSGRFCIKITDQDGTLAETDELPFAVDGKEPISLFEIRSIGWTTPIGKFNGYLDNLVIKPSPEQPTIKVSCKKFGHLYYHGRPAAIVAMIKSGTQAFSGNVDVSVIDGYGNAAFSQSQTITVPAGKEKSLLINVPAANLVRYGLYTVKLAVGETRRIYTQCTLGVIAPPRDIGDNFDSPFGVFHYPVLGENSEFQAQVIEQMHDIGIRWLRCNMHWYNVEPEKGKLDWGKMGVLVDEAYKKKMHAFIELVNTAKWASSTKSGAAGSIDTGTEWSSVAPRDFGDWENFCQKTAEHFSGRVKVYEIWNEPGAPRNGKSNGFWRDSSGNFIKIIKHARKAVLSVEPDAKIMVGGFRPVDMGGYFENFVERVLAGAIDDIDIISFHYWTDCEWGTKMFDSKLLISKYGKSKPYWNTEASGAGKDANNIRSILWSLAGGCEKIFPFIYNLPRYKLNGLVNPDYSPHEGTISFATMTRFLAGFKMEGQLNAGQSIRAFSLTDGRKRIVVAWSENKDIPMPAVVPGAESTMDWQGNPGPEVKKGEYNCNTVLLGNTPVYIFCNLDGLNTTLSGE